MKQSIPFFIILVFLLVFHDATISGAEKGLFLWYQILIPSLLPFILVTNALAEINAYQDLAKKLFPVFKNDTYEIIAILFGNLCGFPIGAAVLNYFCTKKYIESKRCITLLPLASQASPMFIIGYIYTHILNKNCPLLLFLTSIYLPVILYYIFIVKREKTIQDIPLYIANDKIIKGKNICENISETFLSAARTMVFIGIYVMIFSILYELLIPVFKIYLLKFPLSFLEITTGLTLLQANFENSPVFLPMTGMLTAFGGLCSVFQISCVTSMNIKKYLQTKSLLSAGTYIILFLYLMIHSFL